jgi:hypothetical protein
MLVFCLCYFPTVALTNALGFSLVKDPGRESPFIRLMGTFGWIDKKGLVETNSTLVVPLTRALTARSAPIFSG